MAPKRTKPQRREASGEEPTIEAPTVDEPIVDKHTNEDLTVKEAAKCVGFQDEDIPGNLYTLWRAQVHMGIHNWNCYGAGEAGTSKWAEFGDWAAGSF